MARPNNINMAPGGGGGRASGGITGKGGKNVTPIYKQSIPPASVKVINPGGPLTGANENTTVLRSLDAWKRMTNAATPKVIKIKSN